MEKIKVKFTHKEENGIYTAELKTTVNDWEIQNKWEGILSECSKEYGIQVLIEDFIKSIDDCKTRKNGKEIANLIGQS